MKVEATKEHEWLRQLVGEWTFEQDQQTGTESVRMIGDVWAVAEGRGEMPGGGDFVSVMTLGYDPEKKRFVGTFVGSMMTTLWIYDGELDPSGRSLVLHSEGPSFSTPGEHGKYQDTIEIVSPDERTFSSKYLQPDGTWNEFMRATYRRVRSS